MNLSNTLEDRLNPDLLSVSKEIGRLADHHRVGAVMVGGVVRDLLLGHPITEADFMLEFPAKLVVDDLVRDRRGQVTFHEAFQTFVVQFPDGRKVDVATARKENYENPAKLPKVVTSPDIKIPDDLIRRDFSINAMAVWLNKPKWGEILDPFQGLADLKNKLIRVLHNNSFIDDPTRIMRASRFAGRYNYSIENNSEKLLKESIERKIPQLLSPVRRRHEFDLILKEVDPKPALRLLILWGVLPIIHKDWTLSEEDLDEFVFPLYDGTEASFIERLKTWFSQWKPERAELMMTELSIEKRIKRQILSESN